MFVEQAKLPAKQIVSKVAYTNGAGKLLIVKATYKPGWVLVGGMLFQDEGPLAAAIRESKEETGLDIAPERLSLTLVHYTPRSGKFLDHLVLVFAATLSDDEIARIVLPPDELSAYKFIPREAISDYATSQCSHALADMWKRGIAAGYAQDGRFIAPITT